MNVAANYKFGCLLPVKIDSDRLTDSQKKYLTSLAVSMRPNPYVNHSAHAFVGVDADKVDTSALHGIVEIFEANCIPVTVQTFSEANAGQICTYWRILADLAVKEGCDFFGLLGDDVEVHCEGWIGDVIDDFGILHKDLSLPAELFGFGCIALNDRQAPGFPTFPILHRLHYQLNGELFSSLFVNQDADPFLFQLYRRWGVARFSRAVALTNHVGGVELAEDAAYVPPRYERYHVDWSNTLLTEAFLRIKAKCPEVPCFTTVDVVVPTYRVKRDFIERICALKCSAPCVSVNFNVIVDNPHADVTWLKELTDTRLDLRIRINPVNCGASHTRNVGMDESAAEYILFLDDDIIPDPGIIDQYVLAARKHGEKYDGFVGYSELPAEPDRVFPTAVHFSGVTFFWHAAQKMTHIPWGVTANLFVRRSGSLRFDLRYIKTGGGEDIDFCLRLGRQPLCPVPEAKVLHPWWDDGARCYQHFFNWAQSDGRLQDEYPHLTYHALPDAVETCLILLTCASILQRPAHGVLCSVAVLLTDMVIDFCVLWPDRTVEPYSTGAVRILAVLESTLIKSTSCVGRLWGHAKRGHLLRSMCKRFDWFCGQIPDVVVGEKAKAAFRCAVFSVVISICVMIM